MENKNIYFGPQSQRDARLSGEYWSIARELETGECVFCDLREKYIVARNDYAVLTTNLFPYINGQLLVIPNRHIIDISEITEDEVVAMHDLCNKGVDLLKTKLNIDSVWVLLRNGNLAGKTIKHLHWNILPYIEGLNTWHYKEITLTPIDLAKTLRNKDE